MGLERLQVVHMHYCKGQEPAVNFVLMAEEEMYIYVWFGELEILTNFDDSFVYVVFYLLFPINQ